MPLPCSTCAGCTPGRTRTIEWQLESAKLLWAQGQPGIAVGAARALLAEAHTALGPNEHHSGTHLYAARLLACAE